MFDVFYLNSLQAKFRHDLHIVERSNNLKNKDDIISSYCVIINDLINLKELYRKEGRD